ncbi:MAG: hypothetical protein JNJ53_01560 [Rhizobiales bacterium]|nr:hypothetical protein [Hyphomicrobiales bacterium]
MRRTAALFIFLWGVMPAMAGEPSSAYTPFDLAKCTQVAAPDEYVFEGSWSCPGYDGIDIFQSGADARSYVAFGKNPAEHCSAKKTFNPFNTALSPIEWRLVDGKPFAAIERWSIADDQGGQAGTWLVVTALRGEDSCPVHYVAGSYPDANAQARRAADDLARDFDCENDVPTVDSKIGPPPIAMVSCRELSDD